MKKSLFLAIGLLCLLFICPAQCVDGARSGLLLWFNTIIPTLFPFILATNLIREMNGIPYLERLFHPILSRLPGLSPGGSYPVVIGLLCGYPMGAKAVCDSYMSHRINRQEANYLLTFCNNPSPIYMLSYVALYSLDSTAYRLPVLLITYFSIIATAVFMHLAMHGFRHPQHGNLPVRIQETPEPQPGSFFDRCMMTAFELLVKVGGYMILFSMLSQCLRQLPFIPSPVLCITAGLMEQTTGLKLLKELSFSTDIKFILALLFINFGGFSITAQTYSVIRSQGLSVKIYVAGKILCAAIALAAAIFFVLCHARFCI